MMMACFRFLHQKKNDCLNNCDFAKISFVESKEFYEIHPLYKAPPCVKTAWHGN